MTKFTTCPGTWEDGRREESSQRKILQGQSLYTLSAMKTWPDFARLVEENREDCHTAATVAGYTDIFEGSARDVAYSELAFLDGESDLEIGLH